MFIEKERAVRCDAMFSHLLMIIIIIALECVCVCARARSLFTIQLNPYSKRFYIQGTRSKHLEITHTLTQFGLCILFTTASQFRFWR